MSTHAQVLGLRRVRSHLAMNGTLDVAFSLTQQDRHTEMVPLVPVEHRKHKTGNSMAGLRYTSHGRSRQSGYPIRPSAEGRSCWLNFLRKILSFSIPNRFIPAHCVAFFLFLLLPPLCVPLVLFNAVDGKTRGRNHTMKSQRDSTPKAHVAGQAIPGQRPIR